MKLLKQGTRKQQTRLHDVDGNVVGTEQRAETFAKHLETVQWFVRPSTLVPDAEPPLFGPLDVNEGPFTHTELRKAILTLSSGKAVQDNDIPIECFKALVEEPGPAITEMLDIFNSCLADRTVPTAWLWSRVAMIFKKGDPAQCENYRPISVGTTAYKIYTTLLKQRLLDAGIDGRLWNSQFGFRKKYGTDDAIFVARRYIETAVAQRWGQLSLLALDWQKAFDSVGLPSLLDALRRFGVPPAIRDIVEHMMLNRQFSVADGGQQSSRKSQNSGITQGCTLSPLLFIIVMSALMHDAVSLLSPAARLAHSRGSLADIAYADDTLLIGACPQMVGEFLAAVSIVGKRYGMSLQYGKFHLVQVHCEGSLSRLDGAQLAPETGMNYLGTILAESGRISSELSRRIGIAKAELETLSKVWRHSYATL